MKIGAKVIAKWSDGLILSGTYIEHSRGYVILKSDDDKRIVCNLHHVKFEVIDEMGS